MTQKYPWKTDIAVLLLFFTRVDTFRQVFEQVRKARPSRLLLYQDGPRSEKDMPGIMACRQIAEQIDWECEVRRCYQERNYGCDPSGFMSHKWAFSLADKVMVLEDDVVPAQSFFPFCKEMLDRYEKDERVTMIAGFNIDEQTTDTPADYFFTSAFSIWGWASWKRVADQWDEHYGFMKDNQQREKLAAIIQKHHYRQDAMLMFEHHSESGKAYFETIEWANMLLHNGLAIMPGKNQVNNIGMTADSTHFSAELRTTPHRLRRIFTMKRQELTFPLKHPAEVTEHHPYLDRLYRTMAWNHPWIKIGNSLEELWLNLRYGHFEQIGRSLVHRIKKWLGLARHA